MTEAMRRAKLVFVTGSKAGSSIPLGTDQSTIGRGPEQNIRFSPDEILVSAHHATIYRMDDRYIIRDQGSRNGTFVNQIRISEKELEEGDVVEFGPGGPSAQFVMEHADAMTPTLDLSKGKAPAQLVRAAGRPVGQRPTHLNPVQRGFSATREFVAVAYQKTSKRARWTTVVLVLLMAMGIGGMALSQARSRAQMRVALDNFAAVLEAERGSRSMMEQNLAAVQIRYDSLLQEVEQSRLELEANRRSARLSETVNRDFSRGVALLVFSYGFTERGGSDLLRYQVDSEGRRMMRRLPDGRVVPHLGFGGSGPPLSSEGSATGFLVDSAGWILTNRHVARPWESEDQLESLRTMGLDVEPRFIELRAYFPPGDRSYGLVVHAASDDADIGVMRTEDEGVDAPVLPIADAATAVPPGEQLVFIGYPTGVHNLLFRISRQERSAILEGAGENPINLASALAERRLIQPLVIGGSVSDTTGVEIIHTATATGGGSGGPLIGSGATVIGIHYAAVRSPIRGDPFQTQRAVRIGFALPILPDIIQERLVPATTPPDTTQGP